MRPTSRLERRVSLKEFRAKGEQTANECGSSIHSARATHVRIGEVGEIGRVADWLASDFTDYLVGSTIYIDGGMTLYPSFETGG